MIKCQPNNELGIIFFQLDFYSKKKILFEPNFTVDAIQKQINNSKSISSDDNVVLTFSQFQVMITSY